MPKASAWWSGMDEKHRGKGRAKGTAGKEEGSGGDCGPSVTTTTRKKGGLPPEISGAEGKAPARLDFRWCPFPPARGTLWELVSGAFETPIPLRLLFSSFFGWWCGGGGGVVWSRRASCRCRPRRLGPHAETPRGWDDTINTKYCTIAALPHGARLFSSSRLPCFVVPHEHR